MLAGCGRDLSPLLSTGEVTTGVLYPVLDSPVQEKHGITGKSPVMGHKMIKKLE